MLPDRLIAVEKRRLLCEQGQHFPRKSAGICVGQAESPGGNVQKCRLILRNLRYRSFWWVVSSKCVIPYIEHFEFKYVMGTNVQYIGIGFLPENNVKTSVAVQIGGWENSVCQDSPH